MKKIIFLSLSIVLPFLLQAQKGNFYFIENKGQIIKEGNTTINEVKYYTESNGVKMFLTNTGIIYQWEKCTVLKKKTEDKGISPLNKFNNDSFSVETYRTDISLINANPNPIIEVFNEQESYLNFYLSQYPNGVLNVKHYKKLTYKNIYNGIDWVWKFTNEGVKYDFIVHPGADYKQIQLQFDSEAQPKIDAEGNLILENQLGSLVEKAPICFSNDNVIESSFELKENTLSFNVNEYNPTKTLIIDPTLLWGIYFGGSGEDDIRASAVDSLGNYYICGSSYSQSLSTGSAYQKHLNGTADAIISKLDSNGVVIWTTYFGGSNREFFFCLTLDKSLNIYAGGSTSSTNGVTRNAHQKSFGGGNYDGLLTKFSNTGTLLWSTYYGGARNESINGIAVDKFSNVFIAGTTNSHEYGVFHFNGTNYSQPFPRSWIQSGYYAKFAGNGIRLFGTLFGTQKSTSIADLKIDNELNIYFCGHTESNKDITYNAPQPNSNGNVEIFIAKIKSNYTREWVTYFGGEKNEYPYKLDIDKEGNAFICGSTFSRTGIYYKGHSSKFANNLGHTGFLVKLNNNGHKLWSTYYSNGGISTSVATDLYGNVYMVGEVDGVSLQSEIGYNSFKNNSNNPNKPDGFIVKFDSSGTRVWGSFYGGFETDLLRTIAINKKTNTIYAAGTTGSIDNINYARATKYDNNRDGFIIKIVENINDTLTVNACIGDSLTLSLPNLSPNLKVRWFNTLGWPHIYEGFEYKFVPNGGMILWASYYDSITNTQQPLVPKYVAAGDYPKADFIAIDSNQCLLSNNFEFNNNSTVVHGDLSYHWSFGGSDTSSVKNPKHIYDSVKKYLVKLKVISNYGCADSIEKTVEVVPDPVANFNPNLVSFLLCEEEEFTPLNQSSVSTGSLSYLWDFSNGDTTSQQSPTYFYTNQGNYTIQLKVITENGCIDSLSKVVIVKPLPTANTILGGGTAQKNTQRRYYILNTTTNSKYSWDVDGGTVNGAPFGDSLQVQWGLGTTGIITTFEENEFGCTDTVAIKYISLLNTSVNTIEGINYSVYPVPASNYLSLKVNSKVAYTLTDILGKEVAKGIASPSTENRINTSLLNNGVYLLQLHNENSLIASQKIVVRH